jgi:Ca-activated chloride channel homolog
VTFDSPLRLLIGLFVAVAIVLLYRRAERRADAQSLRYSNLDFLNHALQPRTWPLRALRAAFIAALAALVAGVAGPRILLPVNIPDGYVFICIDTSGSMASTDVAPTRAQAALEAARAFINEAPAGLHIGLISFASDAEVVAPLSDDKDQTLAALARIPPPNGATAIGDALRLAASQFPPAGHSAVVLVTDGVSNTGVDPQQMAEYYAAHHVPIYTVGIGTPNGDVIGGEAASIDENALRSYADTSGGAYARAGNAAELRDALAQLGHETAIASRPVGMGPAFLMTGACLLIAGILIGLSIGRLP